jgi:hypothetical protein
MFSVTVGDAAGGRREIVAPAKTEVQAGDAALTAMTEGESILEVREVDDAYQAADVMPPGTQTHPDQVT